ncbi:hypothetical protein H6P81_005875 [Aristolochia fimbriata]|uniref:beta-carotene 3-hydroxylase n=1 Tax=Aristolochia fimbriata TaxID=158543 RepID=A0AAV7EZF8_ARIFI|nr:hypothetical protein H6P81_005875 [Aristolochia fimbriata]
MAAGLAAAATLKTCRLGRNPFLGAYPNHSIVARSLPLLRPRDGRPRRVLTVCFVMDQPKAPILVQGGEGGGGGGGEEEEEQTMSIGETISEADRILTDRLAKKLARKKSQRYTYLVAAIMSTFGITSMAVAAVYYRFWWQFEGGEIPVSEMFGTFALSVGAAVGMEFWARWAHRALWHASLWHMHESHHQPREGPFELNDVFAITNAVPAIGLLSYGFFNKGLLPGLCFGAGLGITVFGMAYMFVHDGLVHRRFPVGPIADVPYFRRVAAAHQIHHSDKFDGVPYGLFLGPKELEEVGGTEELEKEIRRRKKLTTSPRR